MKFFPIAAAMLFALSTSAVPCHGENSFGIAVVINGKVITTSEVREAVEAQRAMIAMTVQDSAERAKKLRAVEDEALFALMERELVLSEFNKAGGTLKPQYVEDNINEIIRENFHGDREKFIAELARQGMTPKKFRELREKMIVVQVMRQRQMKDRTPVTPAQVEGFYEKNAAKFREKDFIKISTITMPKYDPANAVATPETQKKQLEELRTKIKGGANFAQLAKTYSQDSHQDQGGSWDWMERAQMDKQVAEVAFGLKAGNVSQVVDVGSSYMLILCDERRPGEKVPLDKVRPNIEKAIQAETNKGTLMRWTRGLASKAAISPENVRNRFMDYLAKEIPHED